MHKARAFFYVSLGILALAVAFHLGATSAQGQVAGNSVVGICSQGGYPVVVTANGDSYLGNYTNIEGAWTWHVNGNVFGGGPIQTEQTTLGRIKAKYR
jgi:hypothetical protein